MVTNFIKVDTVNNGSVIINVEKIIYISSNIIMKDNGPILDKDHTRLTYLEGTDKVILIINSTVDVFLKRLARISNIIC